VKVNERIQTEDKAGDTLLESKEDLLEELILRVTLKALEYFGNIAKSKLQNKHKKDEIDE